MLDKREFLLKLAHLPGTQYQKLIELMDSLSCPSELQNLNDAELALHGISKSNRAFIRQLERFDISLTKQWLEQPDTAFISYYDAAYPFLLRQIYDPPLGLFVLGQTEVLNKTQVAIVGSRKASQCGLNFAFRLAHDLAMIDMVVTSGLAIGIDSSAHRGGLEHASGLSIAVLACGLDTIYPTRHRALANLLTQRGCLVSEFAPGVGVRKDHFPRRNRIISGLAWGCVVVEADLKSGSLITARRALEQNRQVFAVPGSVYNPFSRGCHQLLREGAQLLESVNDLLEELPSATDSPPLLDTNICDAQTETEDSGLLKMMGYGVISFDELLIKVELSSSQLLARLTELELQGEVSAVPGGFLRLR